MEVWKCGSLDTLHLQLSTLPHFHTFHGRVCYLCSMRIVPLSEGAFTVDKTKEFIPFDQTKDDLQERTTGSLLVEIQPFLIVTEKDVLLLDTGLGFEADGEMQIHQLIRQAGVDPEFGYQGFTKSFA